MTTYTNSIAKNDPDKEIEFHTRLIETFLLSDPKNLKVLEKHLMLLSEMTKEKNLPYTSYFLKMAAESIKDIDLNSAIPSNKKQI